MAASLSSLCRSMRLSYILDQTIKNRRCPVRCCSQNSKNNDVFPKTVATEEKSDSSDSNSRVSLLSQNSEVDVTKSKAASPVEGALDKFAKVVDKVQQQAQNVDGSERLIQEDPNETFASMFRRSKFVSLGEHKGRLVQGEIIEVMEDDLYIDFGGKFHCVCPRPKRNADRYHRGSKVLLSLQCVEMSSAFLGSDIHVTLLEGDATLLGLTAAQKRQTQKNPRASQSEQTV